MYTYKVSIIFLWDFLFYFIFSWVLINFKFIDIFSQNIPDISNISSINISNVFDIKLYNVLEANAIDDIRGKWEDNIRQISSRGKGTWACQFSQDM